MNRTCVVFNIGVMVVLFILMVYGCIVPYRHVSVEDVSNEFREHALVELETKTLFNKALKDHHVKFKEELQKYKGHGSFDMTHRFDTDVKRDAYDAFLASLPPHWIVKVKHRWSDAADTSYTLNMTAH